ncbi:MAG: PIN domain-containing protein [Phormidium tanganyikae FI6-MK23]|nr:PIN domain-containing protein [Phormidium tanganyikae FI6-MK23]
MPMKPDGRHSKRNITCEDFAGYECHFRCRIGTIALFPTSEEVFALAENGAFEAFISASTFSDLYYVIRKQKGRSLALDFVESIAQAFQIATVDRAVISLAFTLGFADFEDAIQCAAVIEKQLDGIVTRDTQDFTQAAIQVFTPIELMRAIV